MSGRERLIGAGLAVVMVVGIIDAAAGHNGSSNPSPSGAPTASGTPRPTTQPTTPTTATATPSTVKSPTGGRGRHHHGTAATTAATPTTVTPTGTTPSSAAPSPAATASPTASLPPGVLGTFSYSTTGGEETNIPGTHRDFPKTTKITNKLEGCGVASTWKPVPQHVQKQVLCPAGDAIKVSSYQTTISFFGVSSGEDFKCSGPSYVYRPGVKAGEIWKFRCKSPDAVAVQKSRVVGYATINVGGTAVRTLHVHVDTKLKGSDSGTSSQDYWIATKKPVLVKEQGTVDATQQGVHYTETYSLALKSLSPKT